MAAQTLTTKRVFILYDDGLTNHVSEALFSPEHWRQHGALRDADGGRGHAWVVSGHEGEWVLRHYGRGGLVRHVNRDCYLWAGLEHTRPWREWRLLSTLYIEGLPVPRPVAAQVVRRGAVYRGDLITCLIPESRSLAAHLHETGGGSLPWYGIGSCLRRFHDAGVCHADLNANNILVDSQHKVYLVDFDRGQRRSSGSRWKQANLKRLHRSLCKLAIPGLMQGHAWSDLMGGYTRAE